MTKKKKENEVLFELVESFNSYGDIEVFCNGFMKGHEWSGNQQEFVIPDDVDIISSDSFHDLTIPVLKIGKNLKLIEKNAFNNCVIQDVVGFEQNTYLNEENCKEILMGKGFEKTLMENKKELPKEESSYELLYNPDDSTICTGVNVLNGGNIEELVIPDGVYRIEKSAFLKQKIKKLVLPSNLIAIGDYAFSSSQIEEVINSENIKKLGMYAFQDNLLKEIDLTGLKNLEIIHSEGAFHNNEIEKIKICHSVKAIPRRLFCNNSIKELDLPHVINYGNESFSQNEISYLKLSKKTDTIGLGAFNSNKLKYIVLPNSLNNIGIHAFGNNNVEVAVIQVQGKEDENSELGMDLGMGDAKKRFDAKMFFKVTSEKIVKYKYKKIGKNTVNTVANLKNIHIEDEKIDIPFDKGKIKKFNLEGGMFIEIEYNEKTKDFIQRYEDVVSVETI